jgi:hypothetical protein
LQAPLGRLVDVLDLRWSSFAVVDADRTIHE